MKDEGKENGPGRERIFMKGGRERRVVEKRSGGIVEVRGSGVEFIFRQNKYLSGLMVVI